MARLRFPGRPGQRFDRLGVRYVADEPRRSMDPSMKTIANIYRGLKLFYELFGDSDEEEDDFVGFSLNEIKKAETIWSKIWDEACNSKPETSVQRKFIKNLKKGTLKESGVTCKKRVRNLPRKSYQAMIREGLAQPSKLPHYIEQIRTDLISEKEKSESNDEDLESPRLKSIKIRLMPDGKKGKIVRGRGRPSIYKKQLSDEGQDEVESSDETLPKQKKRVETEKKKKSTKVVVVKQLIAKAKNRGRRELKSNAPRKKLNSTKMTTPSKQREKRVFHLPTKSSRSLRKITPCKRFLEDSFQVPAIKKPRLDTTSADREKSNLTDAGLSPGAITPDKNHLSFGFGLISPSSFSSPFKQLSASFEAGLPTSPGTGLLDEPLIRTGKRDRRMSQKLLEKISEGDFSGYERSLDSCMKFGISSNFPSTSSSVAPLTSPSTDTKKQAAEIQKQAEAMRKRGNSILQKAKFHLNRKAHDRSKIALAKSLKAEMKKEKVPSTSSPSTLPKIPQRIPASMLPCVRLKMIGSEMLASLQKFSPPLNENKNSSSKIKQAKRKKIHDPCTICAGSSYGFMYLGISSCRACSRRYRYWVQKIVNDKNSMPVCSETGNCVVGRLQSCAACHLKKSMLVFPMEKLAMFRDKSLPHFDLPKALISIKTRVETSSQEISVAEEETKNEDIPSNLSSCKLRKESENLEIEESPEQKRIRRQSEIMSKAKRAVHVLSSKVAAAKVLKLAKNHQNSKLKPLNVEIPVEREADGTTMEPVVGSVEEPPPDVSPHERWAPRIKHVCRKPAIVLGTSLPSAVFPKRGLCLSALPDVEKEQILHRYEGNYDDSSDSDELSMAEIIRRANARVEYKDDVTGNDDNCDNDEDNEDSSSTCSSKRRPAMKKSSIRSLKFPNQMKSSMKYSPTGSTGSGTVSPIPWQREPAKTGLRRMRCKQCPGCTAEDCGECMYCKDKSKFGGTNKMKQSCIHRKCANPQYKKTRNIDDFITKKKPSSLASRSPTKQPLETPDQSTTVPPISGTGNQQQTTQPGVPADSYAAAAAVSSRLNAANVNSSVSAQSTPLSRGVSSSTVKGSTNVLSVRGVTASTDSRSVPANSNGTTMRMTSLTKASNLTKLSSRLHTKFSGTGSSVVQSVTQSTGPRLLQWPISPPLYPHLIKMDLFEAYDPDEAWKHGVALVSSMSLPIRTACFLCGSSGHHDFVYCSLCCEPFHMFCLDECERPMTGELVNWCCRRCEACNVCGRHESVQLLKCDKCKNTYHPQCLGPNYPTKPSRKKKIWICTKCVRCKSCGATTAGSQIGAKWMFDFSLCFDCGILMEKGNFCPVCHKTYSDDDWESKMIQCSICDSWVHSKCENVSDEMYEILSHLPEDVIFTCRKCLQVRPAPWEIAVRREFEMGLKIVLDSVLSFKTAQHLFKYDEFLKEVDRYKKTKAIRCSKQTENSHSTIPSSLPCQQQSVENSEQEHSVISNSEQILDISDSRITSSKSPITTDIAPSADRNLNSLSPQKQIHWNIFEQILPPDSRGRRLRNRLVAEDKGENKGIATEIKADSDQCKNMPAQSENMEGGIDADKSEYMDYCESKSPNEDDKNWLSVDEKQKSAVRICNKCSQLETDCSCVDLLRTEQNQSESSSKLPECVDRSSVSEPTSLKLSADSSVNDVVRTCDKLTDLLDNDADVSEVNDDFEVLCVDEDGKPVELDEDTVVVLVTDPDDPNLTSDEAAESLTSAEAMPSATPSSLTSGGTMPSATPSSLATERTMPSATSSSLASGGTMPSATPSSLTSEGTWPSATPFSLTSEGTMPSASSSSLASEGTMPSATPNSLTSGGTMSSATPSLLASEGTMPSVTPNSLTSEVPAATACGSSSCRSLVLQSKELARLNPQYAVDVMDDEHSAKDLYTIRDRVEQKYYTSVENFCNDFVRVIKMAFDYNEELPVTRRKANTSIRMLFTKEMERIFPWYDIKTCHLWHNNRNLPNYKGMLPNAVLPPSDDHTYAQWLERKETVVEQPSPFKKISSPQKRLVPKLDFDDDLESLAPSEPDQDMEDSRRCQLCLRYGDEIPYHAGRLLYMGQNDWVHINCAMWSAEVYEECDGSLQNVSTAVGRGRRLKCDNCGKPGSTVGCCAGGCGANYHFMCARAMNCTFQCDKKIYCNKHSSMCQGKPVDGKEFSVLRRVCVDTESIGLTKKPWQQGFESMRIKIMAGSLTVECIGELTAISDTRDVLLPINFCSTRVYWSTVDARRRCVYTCRIIEVRPDEIQNSPQISIRDTTFIHDETHPDYITPCAIDPSAVCNNGDVTELDSTVSTETASECEPTPPKTSKKYSREWLQQQLEDLVCDRSVSPNVSNLDSERPGTPIVRSSSAPNLKGLSDNTLRLLGNLASVRSKALNPTSMDDPEGSQLLQIVDRLNIAAAKSRHAIKDFKFSVANTRPGKAALSKPSLRASRSNSSPPDCTISSVCKPPVDDDLLPMIYSKSFDFSDLSRSSLEKSSTRKQLTPETPEIHADDNTSKLINNSNENSCEKAVDNGANILKSHSDSANCAEDIRIEKTLNSSTVYPTTTYPTDKPDSTKKVDGLLLTTDSASMKESQDRTQNSNSPAEMVTNNDSNADIVDGNQLEDDSEVDESELVKDRYENVVEKNDEKAEVSDLTNGKLDTSDDCVIVGFIPALDEKNKRKSVPSVKHNYHDAPVSNGIFSSKSITNSGKFSISSTMDNSTNIASDGEDDCVPKYDKSGKLVGYEIREPIISKGSVIGHKLTLIDPVTKKSELKRLKSKKFLEYDEFYRKSRLSRFQIANVYPVINAVQQNYIDVPQRLYYTPNTEELNNGGEANRLLPATAMQASIDVESMGEERKQDGENHDRENVPIVTEESSQSTIIYESNESDVANLENLTNTNLDSETTKPSATGGNTNENINDLCNDLKMMPNRLVEDDSKDKVENVDSKDEVENVDSKDEVENVDSKDEVENVDSKDEVENVDSKDEVEKSKSEHKAPVKSYPLRRTANRIAGDAEKARAAVQSLSQTMSENADNGDEALREKVVQKIKAESLARSEPSERGPYKCSKCRRLYRTHDSYTKHVEVCDFDVSTSDDEDEEEEEETSRRKSPEQPVVVKRGRGRPPKRKTSSSNSSKNNADSSLRVESPVKRARGRPLALLSRRLRTPPSAFKRRSLRRNPSAMNGGSGSINVARRKTRYQSAIGAETSPRNPSDESNQTSPNDEKNESSSVETRFEESESCANDLGHKELSMTEESMESQCTDSLSSSQPGVSLDSLDNEISHRSNNASSPIEISDDSSNDSVPQVSDDPLPVTSRNIAVQENMNESGQSTLNCEIQSTMNRELDLAVNCELESTANQEVESTMNCELDLAVNCELESTANQEVESTMNCELESAVNCEHESTANQEVESTMNCELESAVNCEHESTGNCEFDPSVNHELEVKEKSVSCVDKVDISCQTQINTEILKNSNNEKPKESVKVAVKNPEVEFLAPRPSGSGLQMVPIPHPSLEDLNDLQSKDNDSGLDSDVEKEGDTTKNLETLHKMLSNPPPRQKPKYSYVDREGTVGVVYAQPVKSQEQETQTDLNDDSDVQIIAVKKSSQKTHVVTSSETLQRQYTSDLAVQQMSSSPRQRKEQTVEQLLNERDRKNAAAAAAASNAAATPTEQADKKPSPVHPVNTGYQAPSSVQMTPQNKPFQQFGFNQQQQLNQLQQVLQQSPLQHSPISNPGNVQTQIMMPLQGIQPLQVIQSGHTLIQSNGQPIIHAGQSVIQTGQLGLTGMQLQPIQFVNNIQTPMNVAPTFVQNGQTYLNPSVVIPGLMPISSAVYNPTQTFIPSATPFYLPNTTPVAPPSQAQSEITVQRFTLPMSAEIANLIEAAKQPGGVKVVVRMPTSDGNNSNTPGSNISLVSPTPPTTVATTTTTTNPSRFVPRKQKEYNAPVQKKFNIPPDVVAKTIVTPTMTSVPKTADVTEAVTQLKRKYNTETKVVKQKRDRKDATSKVDKTKTRPNILKKVKNKVLKNSQPHSNQTLKSNPSDAHPILHSRQEPRLPQPALEEEVIATACDDMPQTSSPTSSSKNYPHLVFEITSDDGFKVQAESLDKAWQKVMDKVQDARVNARLKQFNVSDVKGQDMFGLSHKQVTHAMEQLYRAENCHNYRFKYMKYKRQELEEEPPINDTGCARSEGFTERKPHDIFSFLLSKYRQKPIHHRPKTQDVDMSLKSSRRATSMDLPMAMRFRHLKQTAREAVGVYRSGIHGRGLFCKRNIDAGEMVIEYAGEVIRAVLTDKRERYYESKGIGCYMFRIDDYDVVDATMHGNAARFINHSCDPNCYSKVINVDGKKHIVIFAMRPIKCGEELTYDYKFPIEDVKIPCTCAMKKCRKYLN